MNPSDSRPATKAASDGRPAGGKVAVGLVQMECGPERSANLDRAEALVRDAQRQGAQVVCLQELFADRYFPQRVDVAGYGLADRLPSDVSRRFQALAGELEIVLVVPVYEEAMPGVLFNTALVFDADGADLGRMRKIHIPEGPQYLEKFYFTPGDAGWAVFRTRYCTIGVAICWDEWFPEGSRILGLKGAEVIFYPSAIGSEPDNPDLSTKEAWRTVIRSHGITNGLFVAAVNRVGTEDEMDFYGGSFIGGPIGEIVGELDQREGTLVRQVDLGRIRFARDLLQFHRDRRPETYGEILQRVIEHDR